MNPGSGLSGQMSLDWWMFSTTVLKCFKWRQHVASLWLLHTGGSRTTSCLLDGCTCDGQQLGGPGGSWGLLGGPGLTGTLIKRESVIVSPRDLWTSFAASFSSLSKYLPSFSLSTRILLLFMWMQVLWSILLRKMLPGFI